MPATLDERQLVKRTLAGDREAFRIVVLRHQRALTELVRGRTTLIIAHRFSTLKIAQRILVFEDGKVVASGSSEELLERSARYRALYELQPDLPVALSNGGHA